MRVDHTIELHVHLHNVEDPVVASKLDKILTQLGLLKTEVHTMAGELDRLTTEVSETGTVIQSAIVLLGQLSDLIRQSAGDPAALNALADSLDANQANLAQAIAENTPAAPTAPA